MQPGKTSYFSTQMPMEARLRPWIRAEALPWPDLFWKAVSAFPCRQFEREWEAEFLHLLAEELAADGAVPCVFLEVSLLAGRLAQEFSRNSEALAPVPGFSRRLWEPPPGPPAQDVVDSLLKEEAAFDFSLFARGMALWVDPADLRSFCLQYGGGGGMTVLFLPRSAQADPLAALPQALLENPFIAATAPGFDLRRAVRHAMRTRDERMLRLQRIFSRGWEEFLSQNYAAFVIPRLKSLDFFDNNGAVMEDFFRLALAGLWESEPDGGLLLASSAPFADRLARLMRRLWKSLDGRSVRGDG